MLKVYYTRISQQKEKPEAFWASWVGTDTFRTVQEFKSGKARMAKLLGEGMLRCLLHAGYALGKTDYRIEKGLHGKPYIEDVPFPLYFNISHSGDYVVCVLSDTEIGIDIEKKAEARMAVAYRYFHPDEVCALETLSGPQQGDLFYRFWVVKESFVKYTGMGLSAALPQCKVCFGAGGIEIWRNGAKEKVQVFSCEIDPGYICFVCSAANCLPEVSPFQWPDEW